MHDNSPALTQPKSLSKESPIASKNDRSPITGKANSPVGNDAAGDPGEPNQRKQSVKSRFSSALAINTGNNQRLLQPQRIEESQRSEAVQSDRKGITLPVGIVLNLFRKLKCDSFDAGERSNCKRK